jgi:putative iron-regulated protein
LLILSGFRKQFSVKQPQSSIKQIFFCTKIFMKRVWILALICVSIGCKKEGGPSTSEDEKKEVLKNYANIVAASYEDSYQAVLALQSAVNSFTQSPTSAGFENLKNLWKAARVPYGQTEGYRFYGGPIDDEDGPEGQINAWPMDENWIDYVEGNPDAGIINNPDSYPIIDEATLRSANEDGSETNIATGYHAIEFLVWGQDLYDESAGKRPYTDFVTGAGGTAANQERRATYLKVVTDLLADDLLSMYNEWKEGGAYRDFFVNQLASDSALTYIIRGIGSLSKGELAGERMTVALTNQDQEDEHSCFSDNTHIDIQMNFLSVDNVYKGYYQRTDGTTISGPSLADIIGEVDEAKNQAVIDQLSDARTKVFAIPAPFDQQIIGDPGGLVTDAINSLRLVSDKIADAAFSIGINISF